jgi:menaquinone-dependent protoporphyrinogen oxidase
METKILVSYASKYGATREIAEKIGEELTQHFKVDIASVGEVKDLDKYQCIILGSAVYVGNWRKAARKFLTKNAEILATKKVWLFSSGPTGQGDPAELLKGWKFPEKLGKIIETITPKEVVVFHGSLDVSKLNFIERKAIKMVKAPVGDFRNWDAISDWSKSIIQNL